MSVTFAYSGTVLNSTGYQTIKHRQQAKSNEATDSLATTGTKCSNVLVMYQVSMVCSMTPGHHVATSIARCVVQGMMETSLHTNAHHAHLLQHYCIY